MDGLINRMSLKMLPMCTTTVSGNELKIPMFRSRHITLGQIKETGKTDMMQTMYMGGDYGETNPMDSIGLSSLLASMMVDTNLCSDFNAVSGIFI